MTDREKKLCDVLEKINPDLKDGWALGVALECREDHLTEELLEFIEKNNVTDLEVVEKWLYEDEE